MCQFNILLNMFHTTFWYKWYENVLVFFSKFSHEWKLSKNRSSNSIGKLLITFFATFYQIVLFLAIQIII